jgi:hypothetical protein
VEFVVKRIGIFLFSAMIVSAAGMYACSSPVTRIEYVDAGQEIVHDTACGDKQCGAVHNAVTDASSSCGNCETHPGTQCGDNGTANTCGDTCLPLAKSSACDYATQEIGIWDEYSGECNFIDRSVCISVYLSPDKPCSQCGRYWCCPKGLGRIAY